MADGSNSDLLVQMVRDLSQKVDGLPTRYEFDAINSRLKDIDDKIDKYVLESEFLSYKRSIEDRFLALQSSLTREHEMVFENADGRLETLEDDVETLKRSRAPSWFLPGSAVVIALITMLLNLWLFLFHPTVTQGLPVTPTPIIERVTH